MIKNNVFNLEQFLANQKLIWTKYDSIDENSLLQSEKKFINNLDRYILHTLEEVYEVQEAYIVFDNFEDYISELNDVMMYCGTMLSIVNENLKLLNSEEEFETEITFELSKMSLQGLCIYTLNQLIKVRTFYKKRKWHKHSIELNKEEKYNTLKQAQFILIELIKLYLGYSQLEISRWHPELILSEMILDKQSFVIDLKETN